MNRINVYAYDPDGSRYLAGHFDEEKATLYGEETEWNGHSPQSVHSPHDEFAHEALYRTVQGRWVRHRWSQRESVSPRFEFVTPEEAAEWLLINEQPDVVEQWITAVPEERGPGRPAIGTCPRISVQFSDAASTAILDRAATEGIAAAEVVRRIVEEQVLAVTVPPERR